MPLLTTAFDDIKQLRERWLVSPQRVFASDLQRARLTAEHLLVESPAQVVIDARLRELSMGEWEGREWDSIYRDDRARFDAWGEDWVTGSPPGGESALDLFARVESFARDHLVPLSSSPHPTLIVAHAGSLRALACLWHHQTPSALFDYNFDVLTPVSLWSQGP